ncbi:hypothetical protein U3516DRAFT_571727, partial [Neocallimastix sp. 'constans']
LKDKLEGMKYSRDEEILLFISKLKMIYEELRDLKYKISEEEKYNFLYYALLYDLISGSNIINYNEQ